MIKVLKDNKIYCTRGDAGVITISAKINGREYYTFHPGDIVRLQVLEKEDMAERVMSKEITIENECTAVAMPVTTSDTMIGDYINEPVEYWYEVEVNPENEGTTIIGYSEKGPSLFILLPEGRHND